MFRALIQLRSPAGDPAEPVVPVFATKLNHLRYAVHHALRNAFGQAATGRILGVIP